MFLAFKHLISTKFSNGGGNDATILTEPTYDRVESAHVKDADTRAARCTPLVTFDDVSLLISNIFYASRRRMDCSRNKCA